jgi:hypothetical protein
MQETDRKRNKQPIKRGKQDACYMDRMQGMEEEHRTKTKQMGQNWDEMKTFKAQGTKYTPKKKVREFPVPGRDVTTDRK